MIPPTSIDGTDITGATIDGTDVTEITVDGQTVFTAGPSQSATPALSQFSFVRDFNFGQRGEDTIFNQSGTKMWVVERSSDTVKEFNLSPAFSIQSPSQVAQYNTDDSNPQTIRFNNDGTKFYESGTSDDTIRQYDLNNPFDLSGRTQTGSLVSAVNVQSMDFSLDGSVLIIGGNGIQLEQYNLGTAFDVTTAPVSPTQTKSISGDRADGVEYSTSGDRLFIADYSNDKINEYLLNTAFDISTLGSSINQLNLSSTPSWVKFANDEQNMYLGQNDGNTIEQWEV